ncbi:hypothetical protein MPER_09413 [Moniliophthora perniciosa FA553]|nr:hypothetical protein MPER_09413 [Moniliophthora perniciosa FA553]
MPPIYNKPTADKYDYVIIGGGSGGSGSSRRAASYGKKVAVVEMTPHLGGTCVNVADLREKLIYHAKGYKLEGLPDAPKFDWSSFKVQRDAYIRKLNGIYHSNFDKEGVEFHQGFGRLTSRNTVEVTLPDGTNKYTLEADQNRIATGGYQGEFG